MKRFFDDLFLGLTIVDLLFLDRVVQPMVNWLGRRWGVDFIKLGIVLFTAAALIDFWHIYLVGMSPVIWVMLGSIYICWAVVVWGALRLAKLMRGKFNHARYGLFPWRIIFVLMTIFEIGLFLAPPFIWRVGLSSISMTLQTLSFYVLSCQSPPPKERREPFWSKWLSPAPA